MRRILNARYEEIRSDEVDCGMKRLTSDVRT
jgi:hypothetical protein